MVHSFLKTEDCWFYLSAIIGDEDNGHYYYSSGVRQDDLSNFEGLERQCKADSELTNRLKSLKGFRKELDKLIYAIRMPRHVEG